MEEIIQSIYDYFVKEGKFIRDKGEDVGSFSEADRKLVMDALEGLRDSKSFDGSGLQQLNKKINYLENRDYQKNKSKESSIIDKVKAKLTEKK